MMRTASAAIEARTNLTALLVIGSSRWFGRSELHCESLLQEDGLGLVDQGNQTAR
jgi:hypothetical protein